MELDIHDREGLESRSKLRCCSTHAFGDSPNLTVFRGQEPNNSIGFAEFLRTQNHGLVPVTPDHSLIFPFTLIPSSSRHKIALGAEVAPSAICLRDFRSCLLRIDSEYVKDLNHERSDICLTNALVCLKIGVELISQRVLTPTDNHVDLVERNGHVSRECDRRNGHERRVIVRGIDCELR